MNWAKKRVIVTGGAGFIGSSMVDRLLSLGATVTVVDKLLQSNQSWIWQAKLQRLASIYGKYDQDVQMELMDLNTDVEKFRLLCQGNDVVFHLSAVFGGREFVDTKEVECSAMLTVDHNAISAAQSGGIERFHYASSACVYAPSMNRPGYLLKEDDILSTGEGWKSSDNLYGFAKLMGEMQLIAYHRERGFKSSASRYLTVYGPGELDATHAMAALIEKALSRQDPYEVWGSGEQERGFTYVDDIVEGSVLACEKIEDGTAINLGWDKRFKIRDVASKILEISGHRPKEVYFNKNKPEGPFSRALDISRAKRLTGWEPKIDLDEGLQRTIKWHEEIRGQEKPKSVVPPIIS
jgi:UDP-glucose 4-epimerase